jgi:hypothetical protein
MAAHRRRRKGVPFFVGIKFRPASPDGIVHIASTSSRGGSRCTFGEVRTFSERNRFLFWIDQKPRRSQFGNLVCRQFNFLSGSEIHHDRPKNWFAVIGITDHLLIARMWRGQGTSARNRGAGAFRGYWISHGLLPVQRLWVLGNALRIIKPAG